MMHTLHLLARTCDSVNEWSGRAVAWLTLGMVIAMFAIVVLRYLFGISWTALQESVTYMHALVFMIGAAYTLKHGGHVRVDIFYRLMSARARAWVDLLGTLLLLVPLALFILWISWDYVAVSWERLEGSREPGGLPFVYLLKSAILVMAGLLLVQAASLVIRNALILTGHEHAPAAQELEDKEL